MSQRIVKDSFVRLMFRWFFAFGLNLRTFVWAFKGLSPMLNEYFSLKKELNSSGHSIPMSFSFPCIDDRYGTSGKATGHYFHQDYHVAKRIFEANPERHVDLASRVDGFVAHVAVFRKIEVLDIRPLDSKIENMEFKQFDATSPQEEYDSYCDSLSCLHALEHFGIGRYGDPVDINGHLKGLSCITKVLKSGGTLYLSVPIGPERIEFNAHRVFSAPTISKLTQENFVLKRFSYVDDKGDFHEDCDFTGEQFEDSYNCDYGCGIFELVKK